MNNNKSNKKNGKKAMNCLIFLMVTWVIFHNLPENLLICVPPIASAVLGYWLLRREGNLNDISPILEISVWMVYFLTLATSNLDTVTWYLITLVSMILMSAVVSIAPPKFAHNCNTNDQYKS